MKEIVIGNRHASVRETAGELVHSCDCGLETCPCSIRFDNGDKINLNNLLNIFCINLQYSNAFLSQVVWLYLRASFIYFKTLLAELIIVLPTGLPMEMLI